MIEAGNDLTVLPIFVLPGQVVFPHERVTLDARTGANISLFAALLSRSSSVPAENARKSTWFAITPSFDSRVGTVATVDVDAPKPNWVGGALRLHAVAMFPYELLRVLEPEDEHGDSDLDSWRLDRGFRLCHARRRYDFVSPQVSFDCFPSLGLARSARAGSSLSKGSCVRTRSRSRLITKRCSSVVRSSLVAISARSWAAFDETALLKRLRTVATYHERFLRLDEHLLASIPKGCDTPAKWSYWFAAALSEHTSEAQQIELLEERIPALRLRHLLQICDSFNPQQARNKNLKVHVRGRKRPQLPERPIAPYPPGSNTLVSPAFREKLSTAAREAIMTHPLPIFDKRSFSEIRRERTT